MNAQVLLLVQELGNGVGDTADAQLQTVAVVDHVGDQATDGVILVVGDGIGDLGHGIVHLHEVIHLVDVEGHVTHGTGSVGVDLQNHRLGLADHLHLIGVGDGQGHIAVLIRHGGNAHIDVGLTVEQALGSGQVQVVGDIGDIAVGMGLAQGGGVEPTLGTEAVLIGLVEDELIVAHRQAVGHHHVRNAVGNGVQVGHKLTALTGTETGNDIIAALDNIQCFLDRYILCHSSISFIGIYKITILILYILYLKLPQWARFYEVKLPG